MAFFLLLFLFSFTLASIAKVSCKAIIFIWNVNNRQTNADCLGWKNMHPLKLVGWNDWHFNRFCFQHSSARFNIRCWKLNEFRHFKWCPWIPLNWANSRNSESYGYLVVSSKIARGIRNWLDQSSLQRKEMYLRCCLVVLSVRHFNRQQIWF